jgi:predicted phosphohydrolase
MEWVTSDTHFGHAAIIKYCNRPFKDAKHMDNEIIKRWNRVVKQDDTVYHLGDFALTAKKVKIKILNQLNGHKVLILGNHDKTIAHNESIGFEKVVKSLIKGNVLMNHVGFKNIPTINVSVDNWNFYPIPLPTPRDFLHLCGHSHNAWVIRDGNIYDE